MSLKSFSRLFNLTRSKSSYYSFSDVYPFVISSKKEKLMKVIKEKSDAASKSELARKIKVLKGFYTVEMAPPGLDEMQKMMTDLALVREFIKSGAYKYLTVKQLWLLFLVTVEVYLWFYLGETVGKFHIVGYKV